eukprot:5732995-Pleurochrysis_carterae.AAC.4
MTRFNSPVFAVIVGAFVADLSSSAVRGSHCAVPIEVDSDYEGAVDALLAQHAPSALLDKLATLDAASGDDAPIKSGNAEDNRGEGSVLPATCASCSDPSVDFEPLERRRAEIAATGHFRGKYDRTGRNRKFSQDDRAGAHWQLINNLSLGTQCPPSCPYKGKVRRHPHQRRLVCLLRAYVQHHEAD